MTEGTQERPKIDPHPYYESLNPRSATLEEIETAKVQNVLRNRDDNLARLRTKHKLSNLDQQTEESEKSDAQKIAALRYKLSNLSKTKQIDE